MTERAPKPGRDAYRWFKPLETRWRDNDMFGHVNNVVYYSFADSAITRYLIDHCGLDAFNGNELPFTINSGCRYHRPISYPETIDAGLRIGHIGTSSIRWAWALFQQEEPEAAADGHFVHVFVDRATQRPVPVPAHVRTGLERILVDAGGENLR